MVAAIIAVELLVVIKFGANVFEAVDVAVAVAGWLGVITAIILAATAGTLLWKKLKASADPRPLPIAHGESDACFFSRSRLRATAGSTLSEATTPLPLPLGPSRPVPRAAPRAAPGRRSRAGG